MTRIAAWALALGGAVVGAALTLAGTAIAGDGDQKPAEHRKSQAGRNPCYTAWGHQVVGKAARPTNAAARRLGQLDGPRVGLLPSAALMWARHPGALCVDEFENIDTPGWQLRRLVITAVGAGVDGRRQTMRSIGTGPDAGTIPLYVPLDGCVTVTTTTTAVHRPSGKVGTWQSKGRYGKGC